MLHDMSAENYRRCHMIEITLPLTREKVSALKSGDRVYITGTLYTGRDAAHKRLIEQMERGEELPFDLKDAMIYYVGPAPAKENQVIGSAGPTTSYRMDPYTPPLLKQGLRGMIGKGKRSPEVIEAIKENKAVYFAAVGGAAALIARSIKEAEVIAYHDLGTEAVRRLYVERFPAIVVIDEKGNNLYESEKEKYRVS